MHPVLREAGNEEHRLAEYAGRVAERVGLRDHTFEVRIEPLPPGTRATCKRSRSHYSVLTVCEDFTVLSPEEQREAVVHEELHVHLHPLYECFRGVRGELGRAHFESVERAFRLDLEQALDALTAIVAPTVPLP